MIVKDIMAAFELFQPTQLKDAFSVLDSYGKDAWKMAGGYDSMDWFKDRIVRPKAVVDLTGIPEMKGIKETADGVEIGADDELPGPEPWSALSGRGRVRHDPCHRGSAVLHDHISPGHRFTDKPGEVRLCLVDVDLGGHVGSGLD